MGSDMSKANSGKTGQDSDFVKDYKKASKKYPDVKNIEHKLEAGIERIIDAVENGGAENSVSLDSLKVVTSWLAEKDEHLKNLILKNKKIFGEIRNCSSWITYISNSMQSLPNSKMSSTIFPTCNAQYTKCKEFFNLLKFVRQQHEEIVEKVKGQKKKLDRKFKRIRVWRKISNVIFASAFATVVIFSVLAVMAVPPIVLVVAAIPLIPIAPTGNLINSRLTKYENTINSESNLWRALGAESN
ncbi:UPF0496 protein At4g34330-like [Cryptomeria japonica]|uniref:UPF0496 protein At4g34330-like n=1 Tax=Cryptomeria japonica TaxID=3369 RepID=UPI0027D9ED06|nr:UPF0496 protein At4g34330-like [Cryptomeria japonica]